MSGSISEWPHMPPPSLARDFFDRVVGDADPVAFIRSLVNSTPPTVETDWLDFKTEDTDPSRRDRKSRRDWSEALGGFANNQGGVLIWGIDARKTQTPEGMIDAARAEKPVASPLQVRSKLVEWHRGATDPPHSNVDVRAFPLPEDAARGFVVCYVPEGPFKPYRSEQAEQQYYLRAGDSTHVMSRSILASLFHPRPRALFRVRGKFAWQLLTRQSGAGRDIAELLCDLELVNVGTASAKEVTVRVSFEASEAHNGEVINPHGTLWSMLRIGEQHELRAVRTIHPQMPTMLCSFRWYGLAAPTAETNHVIVPTCGPPEIDLTVACDDQPPQGICLRIDNKQFLRDRRFELDPGPTDETGLL
jgi:hypothetical protein